MENKMNNVSSHKQVWAKLTRHTLSGIEGSIVLEVYHEPQGHYKIEAFISNLMVEQEYRRKGVAKSLIRWAEGVARAEGFDKVFLEWHSTESPQFAHDWYERRGYKEIAFGNDGCLMMKEL